jgi:fatty acid desaturase
VGYGTAWIAPNLFSAFLISQGNVARWTIVAHHVSHRGFDRVPGAPERFRSRTFAGGLRRIVDWLDWIDPEAWRHEHDVLHHYRTGELADPDLVEENVRYLRDLPAPRAVKYALIGLHALSWKLTYYAPSSFQALSAARRRRAGLPSEEGAPRYADAFNPLTTEGREFWRRCLLPYALARFVAVPALALPLGPFAAASVLANSVMAEAIANVHSFLIVVPNHAGDDLHRFDDRGRTRAEFYVRQVTGSANFNAGGDLHDFLHGYLNYQIEHHLFPDLPPLRYREIRPRVKAICAQYGVPYVEDSVWARARKMLGVMTGETSMKRAPLREPEPRPAPEMIPSLA